MRIRIESIKRDYAHRIEADPATCPVCCGDTQTTDREFGGAVVHPESKFQPSAVYECLACEVYYAATKEEA